LLPRHSPQHVHVQALCLSDVTRQQPGVSQLDTRRPVVFVELERLFAVHSGRRQLLSQDPAPATVVPATGVAGLEFDGAALGHDRLGVPPQFVQAAAEPAMQQGEVWALFDQPTKQRYRFFVTLGRKRLLGLPCERLPLRSLARRAGGCCGRIGCLTLRWCTQHRQQPQHAAPAQPLSP
jgi:hypothetical protein